MSKAMVVLSGGQDSTTCLYWAIAQFGRDNVATLTFDYGQRHRLELDCARQVAAFAGVPNTILSINTFAVLGGNALTDKAVAVKAELNPQTQLPNTFVPGRNLIFLTFAAVHAYPRGIEHLVAGMAQTDYSGYPDCRQDTLKALEQAIHLGMEFNITLHTPLMFKSKKEPGRVRIAYLSSPERVSQPGQGGHSPPYLFDCRANHGGPCPPYCLLSDFAASVAWMERSGIQRA